MDKSQIIATARHYEALSARAWPTENVIYDGLWVKRFTQNHGSLRLNCIMPLDPADDYDCEERIKKLCYDENNIFQLSLRQTPLCSLKIIDYLENNNWLANNEIALMRLDFLQYPQQICQDSIILQKLQPKEFVALSVKLNKESDKHPSAYLDLLARIKGEVSCWQFHYKGDCLGAILTVRDFNEIGLLDFTIDKKFRKQGLGRAALQCLFATFQQEQADKAVKSVWLQVETANKTAINLYQELGFITLYTCRNWSPFL